MSTVGDDSSYWEGEIIDTRPKTSWTSVSCIYLYLFLFILSLLS